MRISSRERKLAIATGVLALCFLLFQTILAPLVGCWRMLRAETTALETELLKHRASIRQKEAVERQYQELQSEILQRGTNEEVTVKLLQSLQEMYSGLGLVDKGTRVHPVEEGGFYCKYSIRMDLEGTVPALGEFLHAISAAKQPLRVEQLTVTATGRYEMVRVSMLVTAIFAVSSTESRGLG